MRPKTSKIRYILAQGAASFAIAASLGVTGSASAEVCIPNPAAVPRLAGGPCWASTCPATNPRRTDLNEPRWASSPRTFFDNDPGTSTTTEGGYRIVVSPDQSELSVSFQDLADVSETNDAVYLGLEIEGTTQRIAVRIPNAPGALTEDNHAFTSAEMNTIDYYTAGTNTWAAGTPNGWSNKISGAPAWLSSVASWKKQTVEAGGADWGVQFKINLKHPEINVFDNSTRLVKVFLALGKTIQTTDGERPAVPLTSPALPVMFDPADAALGYLPDTIIPRSFSLWTPAQGLGGTAKCMDGVEIKSAMDISTTNGDGADIFTNPGQINTFRAKIYTPDAVVAGDIAARFRLANWGAEIPTAEAWKDIPNGSSVLNGAVDNMGVLDKNLIQFDCPANTSSVCGAFAPPPAGETHQCLQVSLSNAPATQGRPATKHKITQADRYRNMTFVTLSTKTIPAEISIKGLQKLYNNVARDRYVITQIVTRNMPAFDNFPRFLDGTLMNALKLAAVGLAQWIGFSDLSLSGDDSMKTVWPTYEAHSYYDTGRTFKIKGITYKQYRPMNSFGYYMSHSGVYYGFTHAIAGTGITLSKVGTNLTKVLVRNESSVKINTGVSAEEVPKWLTAANFTCRNYGWLPGC